MIAATAPSVDEIGATTPTFPIRRRGVHEQQAGDVAEAGEREPVDRAAVQARRPPLGERDRPDDEQAGEHHPGERRRSTRSARLARDAVSIVDRPGDRRPEAAENRDHRGFAAFLARTGETAGFPVGPLPRRTRPRGKRSCAAPAMSVAAATDRDAHLVRVHSDSAL